MNKRIEIFKPYVIKWYNFPFSQTENHKLIQDLWSNHDVMNEDLEYKLEKLKNPHLIFGCSPELIEDTIALIKDFQEIPENERIEMWCNIYNEKYKKQFIHTTYDCRKAKKYNVCQHPQDAESCSDCKDDEYHQTMGYICPICQKQICVVKLVDKELEQ